MGTFNEFSDRSDSIQIIQQLLEFIKLKVVKGKSFSDTEFKKALAKVKELTNDMEVEISFIDKISLTPAGKWRNVINETNLDVTDYLFNS